MVLGRRLRRQPDGTVGGDRQAPFVGPPERVEQVRPGLVHPVGHGFQDERRRLGLDPYNLQDLFGPLHGVEGAVRVPALPLRVAQRAVHLVPMPGVRRLGLA
ncbi:hypothetical protein GCM10025734_79190 [Kitasatospora paranensis]|uniref:hypothetical protein n=1 Tax=Kitasatospora paranensis TaxID=258053 RepID=UPI0031EFE4A2